MLSIGGVKAVVKIKPETPPLHVILNYLTRLRPFCPCIKKADKFQGTKTTTFRDKVHLKKEKKNQEKKQTSENIIVNFFFIRFCFIQLAKNNFCHFEDNKFRNII